MKMSHAAVAPSTLNSPSRLLATTPLFQFCEEDYVARSHGAIFRLRSARWCHWGTLRTAPQGSGLVEDLTKRVSPLARLVCTMAAAALAYFLLNVAVTRISVPPLDFLLSYAVISCAVTVLAVAALANAINIIDGFNGLASMVAFMMVASLAYVAFQVSDPIVLSASFMMMGAVLGFFIWNFPAGLIFLGDGGAYFIGFMLAELSIMLVMRDRDVSAR